MNRFFSKLDLRDIKINPEGSSFPPDADEHEQEVPEAVESLVEIEVPEAAVAESIEAPAQATSASETIASTLANGVSHDAPAVVTDRQVMNPNGRSGIEIDDVIIATDGEVLKVSARSRPSAVAGAIAGVVRESGRAEVQAIGAGATNQAVKAVAIARDYLRETGIEAVCLPAFIDVTIENEDRTAIRLVVEPR